MGLVVLLKEVVLNLVLIEPLGTAKSSQKFHKDQLQKNLFVPLFQLQAMIFFSEIN